MTDNTQLDEILLGHGAEEGEFTESLKQAILDWHNKQIEEVLDRLESMAAYDTSGMSPVINPREIEAERTKLKEEEV